MKHLLAIIMASITSASLLTNVWQYKHGSIRETTAAQEHRAQQKTISALQDQRHLFLSMNTVDHAIMGTTGDLLASCGASVDSLTRFDLTTALHETGRQEELLKTLTTLMDQRTEIEQSISQTIHLL